MKRNFLMMVAMAAVMAACTGKSDKTTVTGSFEATEAPASVEVVVGYQLDTVIAVVDGKFKIDVPVDRTGLSYVVAEGQPLQFISDGSTLNVDFFEKKVSSSDKKGIQSRMNSFLEWQDAFMADYQSKMADLDEDGQEELTEETLEEYNDYLKKLIKENSDNVLALIGVRSLQIEDPEELMEVLNGLTYELKSDTRVAAMISSCQTQLATGEGKKFVDFTVVQDPEHPETSTVSLSDYVGKGKYILVDFWASWCGPCKEETPYLQEVYKKYKGDKFDMLSIAVSDEPEDSRRVAKELGITWNQIVNARQIPGDTYGIQYIPHIILFGPDGTILKRELRGEEIGKAVAEALGE